MDWRLDPANLYLPMPIFRALEAWPTRNGGVLDTTLNDERSPPAPADSEPHAQSTSTAARSRYPSLTSTLPP